MRNRKYGWWCQRSRWGGSLLCALVLGGVGGQGTAFADNFVVRKVRLFDGARVVRDKDVLVESGVIRAVGENLQIPETVEVIDGAGATLMPGLIDSHAHTWGEALKEAIVFGVTTELDMFTDIQYVQKVKQGEAAGKNGDMADMRSAGTLATVRSGHGTQYGVVIPTLSTPAEAKGWVSARIQEGSDYIKIVYDDGSAYGRDMPTLSKETMKALIDATHDEGKLAIVHIGTQQQAREAIEAGADGLAHLFAESEPSADFADFAAKHRVFVVPTLSVLESVSGRPSGESLADDARLEPFLAATSVNNLKSSFPKMPVPLKAERAERTVRALNQAGVKILAGTDAPNPGTAHGASMHRELELLVRSGMTPMEALAAATSVPAASFGLTDRGQIAAGKRADLVLVKGDPTQDITATREIIAVWKAGVRVDRESYRSKIERAKTDAKKLALSAPKPKGAEMGTISDFEDNQPSVQFGAGLNVSTDDIIGGKSTAEMKTVDGGANGSKHSLKVSGKVDGGLPYAWAGVMFSPGDQIFRPANLSVKKEIAFWVKGDGKPYRAMIFTESGGRIPSQQTFKSTKEWNKVILPFSSFNGTDGHDVTAILFVGGPAAGEFDFWLDDIGLQ